MGQDKKQLRKLLAFVKEIYDHPDNKEFAEGIREMVLSDKDFQERLKEVAPGADPESLKRIEKYLSLDYEIDEKIFPDYSVIKDDDVRARLLADFREMLRYRFGTRNHKIDFAEFCRYATLQIELLVNYYFEKRYSSDITKIIQAVIDGNSYEKDGEKQSYYKPNHPPKDVADIGLKFKIQTLQNEFSWQYKDISSYLNIIEVRNRQSHRSLRKDEDLIQQIGKKLNSPEFKVDGKIDNEKAKAVLGYKTVAEYWFQVWLDKQDFDNACGEIKKMCSTIGAAI